MLSKIKNFISIVMVATFTLITSGLLHVTKYFPTIFKRNGFSVSLYKDGELKRSYSEEVNIDESDPNMFMYMLIVEIDGEKVKVKDHGKPEQIMTLEEFKKEYSHILSSNALKLVNSANQSS